MSHQEFQQHFPKGPDCLEDLFNWHVYNADTLMKDEAIRTSFINLVSSADHIVLHEDYAGMGTCGVSLAAQFRAMRTAVAAHLPTRPLTLNPVLVKHYSVQLQQLPVMVGWYCKSKS